MMDMNRRAIRTLVIGAAAVAALAWTMSEREEPARRAERGLAPSSTPDQPDAPARTGLVTKARATVAAGLRELVRAAANEDAYDHTHLNEDKLARTPEEHEAAGMTMLGLYAAGQYSSWFAVANDLRASQPELSAQVWELGKKLAVAGRPYAKVDLPSLLDEERAMLRRARGAPSPSSAFASRLEGMATNIENMARGNGPSVAARLEHEAQQPMQFQRRSDSDNDKSEPEEE
jgi:hypothetical protein